MNSVKKFSPKGNVKNTWQKCPIGALGRVVTGKTPSSNNPEDFGAEIPFVTPSDYGAYNKYAAVAERSLSSIGAQKLQNKLLPPRSVMVTCIGSDMGKVAVNFVPVITNQQINSIIPDPKKVDPDYLYYALRNAYGILREYGLAGTAVPILNKTDFEGICVDLPAITEQRAIAAVLSSLDDKIDLLHRQNKTLESLAATCYSHFFVDNRKTTWAECSVEALAAHDKTSVHPQNNPTTTFYHYSIPAFDDSHMPAKELGESIQSNKYKVSANTILFSKLNPHRDKRIWLIPEFVDENSVCSTEFQVLRPKSPKTLFFLYGFVSHSANYDEIASGVCGTSGSHQRIDPGVIFKFNGFTPDDGALNEYNKIIAPIFTKMHANRESIVGLRAQREFILPKLISGEVKVAC